MINRQLLARTGNSPLIILHLALWFALLAGLFELSVLAVNRFLLHHLIRVGTPAIWVVPLIYLCIAAIPALALSLLSLFWSKPFPLSIPTFIFAFVGFLGLLLMFHPKLHEYAALLLAAGLATQTSRLVAAHSQGFYRLLRRTTIWLLALIAVPALGTYAWQAFAEQRAMAQLPPLPAETPNVLLIVLDTVRAQSLSMYGYQRLTSPNLERFADRSVVFEQALSTAPWTLPSHASMFTARYPHEHAADWFTPLDGRFPTLAEVLRAKGYRTGGFVANKEYCSEETGLSRGFIHYEDYQVSLEESLLSCSLTRFVANNETLRRELNYWEMMGRKRADTVNRDFLNWLSQTGERPFFAFLNYFDAHEPYFPPAPFNLKYGPQRGSPDRPWKREYPADHVEGLINAYDSSVSYMDTQLGSLFEELQSRGLLAKTLVIITADHGEEFFEHGIYGHGHTVYLPVLRVPLIISLPSRVPSGKRIAQAVTLRDLPATVLDILKMGAASPFPGFSMARYWDGTPGPPPEEEPLLSELSFAPNLPDWFPVSKGAMKSVVSGRWHYIKNGDGTEELYDLDADRSERHDLAEAQENRPLLNRLRACLEKTQPGDARAAVGGLSADNCSGPLSDGHGRRTTLTAIQE